MGISQILVFTVYSLLTGWLLPKRWRTWALLIGSLTAVYWLQPSTPLRHLDFWLPSASIGLTVFVWGITSQRGELSATQTRIASLLIVGIMISVGLLRYAGPVCCITPTRPPNMLQIMLFIGLVAVISAVPYYLQSTKSFLTIAGLALLLALFVIIKTEPLAQSASAWMRSLTGQSTELASSLDIPWLGFSYLSFRLLHILRDAQQGRLSAYTLGEFTTYALFFSTYPAGPIDRIQRFTRDLREPLRTDKQSDNETQENDIKLPKPDSGNLAWGGKRILIGAFRKFVIADSLALIALNAQNAAQVNSSIWAWVLLYAYALRIYFDFSGYTDIALGLGRLVGFKLPENFESPYLKQNLTTFWNSWHMTLAQWFRAYFFNPLTRFLRTTRFNPPTWAIIMIGQISTMLLIGLWHGVTWNFAIWGVWHGLGLFIHNRWSGWIRPRIGNLESRPGMNRILQASGWFLTFNYVTLGWVWFALPNTELALGIYQKLLGF
jgi:alginate O-acetyltransferase complex protein AlgI